jgi:predicted dehydrogenase
LRLAIAGLGSAAGRGHFPALERSTGLQLVAAADPAHDQRAAFASTSSVPVFADVEAMLDSVTCDALLVTSSPDAHASLIMAGLRRDIHVICEKPLVLRADEHDELARLAARTTAALISVHQYRCAGPWRLMARVARTAIRLRQPFALRVTVRRPGPDPLAVTSWRSDRDRFGGMLADHGVHYFALAWTIKERLDVLGAHRTSSAGDEACDVLVDLGAGTAHLHLDSGAFERSTHITLSVARRELRWDDQGLSLEAGGRTLWRGRADGLASRAYVDGLYGGFYREVAQRLGRDATWQARRTAESLLVNRAMLATLEWLGPAAG